MKNNENGYGVHIHFNVQFNGDNRITRESLNMGITYLIGLRGTCERAKVGAIILKDNRIISTGYNGDLLPKDCKRECDFNKPCVTAVHAEVNAIAAAAKYGIELGGSTMYCLYSPCMSCANLIIQSGISIFYYWKEYRDLSGLELLSKSGLQTFQFGFDAK